MAVYCGGCGTVLADSARFCKRCGRAVNQGPDSAAASTATDAPNPSGALGTQASLSHVPQSDPPAVRPVATPSPSAATEAVRRFVTGLDKPARVTAIGAAVAAVAFFLPQHQYAGSTGFSMGGTYLLRLLAALGILALVYGREQTEEPVRTRLACAQLALGAAYGIAILDIFGGGVPGFGYLLVGAGFTTAAIGAYLEIVAVGSRNE